MLHGCTAADALKGICCMYLTKYELSDHTVATMLKRRRLCVYHIFLALFYGLLHSTSYDLTTLSHHIENSKIREQTGVNLDGRLKLTVLSGPVLFINSNIFISGINTKSILYSNIMLLLDLNGTTTCFELEDTRSM